MKQTRTKRRMMIDELALSLRKPRASPLVEPAEAIAIALTIVPSMSKRLLSPEGPEARAVLLALKLSGWKIVAS